MGFWLHCRLHRLQSRFFGYKIGFVGYNVGFFGYKIGFLGYKIVFFGYKNRFFWLQFMVLGYRMGFLVTLILGFFGYKK